jgi:hypothetical protein
MRLLPPTTTPARRVRRLHLRAAVEDDARRASILLADALHTASWSVAEQGRLVVIRRLALGRISTRASPATLALLVERAVREATAQVSPFDLSTATNANAVMFPGRFEALLHLARLSGRGERMEEWFWPAVVPGWQPGLPRADRWSFLLETAHTLPEAARAAAAVVNEAITGGRENEWLSTLSPGIGLEWLQREGWERLAPATAGLAARTSPIRRTEVIQCWQEVWGPVDDRLVWLATMLAVHEKPARAADPQLPARMALWLKSTRGPVGTNQHDPAQTESAAREGLEFKPPLETQAKSTNAQSLVCGQSPTLTALSREPGSPEPARPCLLSLQTPEHTAAESRPAASLASPALLAPGPSGEFTPFAGLLFVVPILGRLGFAEFLAAHPALLESGFPAGLLRFVGRRIGLRDDDPLARWLNEDEDVGAHVRDFRLPECATSLLNAPKPRLVLESPFVAWLTAVRRWCRRHARFGLVTLIRRPGRVLVSRTHLDVFFELAQADLRLRRLALDVDPGWVPWLGRVVRFQYLDAHEWTG